MKYGRTIYEWDSKRQWSVCAEMTWKLLQPTWWNRYCQDSQFWLRFPLHEQKRESCEINNWSVHVLCDASVPIVFFVPVIFSIGDRYWYCHVERQFTWAGLVTARIWRPFSSNMPGGSLRPWLRNLSMRTRTWTGYMQNTFHGRCFFCITQDKDTIIPEIQIYHRA